jgi:hypothetical protein
MAGEHLQAQARRVVAGLDADGKSTIVIDEITKTRVATPGFTVCDLWQLDHLPSGVDDDDTLGGEVALDPPASGLVFRQTTFPPDSEWDLAAGYADALAAMDGSDAYREDDGGIAGLHQTDTIDIITVLSGELYAVLEKSETLLRPGDTFVQRGTKHTWRNRGDVPATIAALMMPAKR